MSFHPKMSYDATFHKSARALEDEGRRSPTRRSIAPASTRSSRDTRPISARSAVLPALYLAQRQQGYITANAIRHVADLLGITRADVEDVVTFYTMFYTKPVGKFVLQVCRTLSCALNGAERVTEALGATLGIKPGETDASGTFTLVEVECLGACDPGARGDGQRRRGTSAVRPEEAVEAGGRHLRAVARRALRGCHHGRGEK